MPIDYSKWDSVEISDDDSDCHPNVDKDYWIRLKKDAHQRQTAEDQAQRVKDQQSVAQTEEQLQSVRGRIRAEESKLQDGSAADEAEANRILEELRKQEASLSKNKGKLQAKIQKEDEREARRDWSVKDKWDHSAVNKQLLPADALVERKRLEREAQKAKDGSQRGTINSKQAANKPQGEPSKKGQEVDGEETLEDLGLSEEDVQQDVDRFIQDMEQKARAFAQLAATDGWVDASFEHIQKFPELVCKQTAEYLLLVGSDLAMRMEEDQGRLFVHQHLVMQYCLDLGHDGVSIFFNRMRKGGEFEKTFQKDMEDFWPKILDRSRTKRKDLIAEYQREQATKQQQTQALDLQQPPPSQPPPSQKPSPSTAGVNSSAAGVAMSTAQASLLRKLCCIPLQLMRWLRQLLVSHDRPKATS